MAEPKEYYTKTGERRYEMRVYVGPDDFTGKPRQRHKAGFTTKKEARLWAAGVKVAADKGELETRKSITFEVYSKQWLQGYQNTVRETTFRQGSDMLRLHILPLIGQQQLTRVTTAVLQRAVNQWAVGHSRALYVRCFQITGAILRNALEQGYIVRDPTRGVIMPRPKQKPGDAPLNFWTRDELAAFLAIPELRKRTQWFTVFNVLAFSGMRCGELVALEWSDVDFEHGTIRINKTASRGLDKTFIVQPPKSAAGRRTIPLDAQTMDLLRHWRVVQAQLVLASGHKRGTLVFPTRDGGLIQPSTVNDVFTRFQKRHHVAHRITAHGLRHTHASAMLAAGVTPKEIQRRLGHSDISITLNRYVHLTDGQEQEAADTVAGYLRQAK